MSNQTVENHYFLLCGVFSYNNDELYKKKNRSFFDGYTPWFLNKPRIGKRYFSMMQDLFYPNVLDVMVPEYSLVGRIYDDDNPMPTISTWDYQQLVLGKSKSRLPLRLTSRDAENIQNCSWPDKVKPGQKKIPFSIEYGDIIFFPEDCGIYTFKVRIQTDKDNHGTTSLEDLSALLNALRNFNTTFLIDNEPTGVTQFINNRILHQTDFPKIIHTTPQDGYMSKLKLFTVLEMDLAEHDTPSGDNGRSIEDEILMELGTVSPIGTMRSDNRYSLSDDYFNGIIESQKFSVYKWWSALMLNDTVTVLINEPESKIVDFSTFTTFEDMYLPLYLEILLLKFSLFDSNYKLSRMMRHEKHNQRIRDQLIEIRNKYNFSHVSNNFLPNLLYQHFKQGMDIDSEIESMEQKIGQINDYINERLDSSQNKLLTFISFMTVGSAFADTSAWLTDILGLDAVGSTIANIAVIALAVLGGSYLIITGTSFFKKYISKRNQKIFDREDDKKREKMKRKMYGK